MSTVSQATETLAKSLVENASEIKIGIGTVLGVAAFGLAIRAGIKIHKNVEKIKKAKKDPEIKEKETRIEVVKEVAKDAAPAVLVGVAAVALNMSGVKGLENEKKEATEKLTAALATAAVAKTALKNKEEAIKECTDEKTQEEIKAATAKKYFEHDPIQNNEITMCEVPEQIFFDPVSGRYFMSSMNKVNQAFKKLNQMMKDQKCVSANEYFWELGLKELDSMRRVGWIYDIDGLFDFVPTPEFTTDGRTCTMIGGIDPPEPSYYEVARKYNLMY